MSATRFALVALFAVACVDGARGAQPATTGPSCQQPEPPALTQARRELERDGTALRDRFAVADALLARGCNESAVQVLEAAEARGESSSEVQRRLREARSLVSEQRYIEGLGQAEEAARLQRLVLRCGKLGDLTACDDALKVAPANPAALQGRSDAVRKLSASCLAGSGASALSDCDVAISHGAPDASALSARRQSLAGMTSAAATGAAAAVAAPVAQSGARPSAVSAAPAPRVAANAPRQRRYSNEDPATRAH